jgi:hypothetical protein
MLFIDSFQGSDHAVDGLNSLVYKVDRIETKLLYTKLLISLPPPPKDALGA